MIKSNSQEDVLNYLCTIPDGITFVHGKAGSGKTYLIKKLVGMLNNCQVLAPTNLAASLYHGARTIHSFFYDAIDDLDEGYQNPQNLENRVLASFGERISSIKMIIIDEISMVRSDLFEMMNQICQKALQNNRPFGGIPIVLVGDLFQLPPVVSDDAVYEYLKREYGGIYFFNSHIIQREVQHIKFFELTKSYRQANDPSFVKILDTFRQPMTAEQKIEVIDLINTRVTTTLPNDAIYVASANEEVRLVNNYRLSELPGQMTTIDAEYTIQKRDRTGHVVLKHSQLSGHDEISEIVIPSAYDAQFTFKKGARVMFTKNSKPRYINGDFGTIEDYNRNGQYFEIRVDRTGELINCPDPCDRYKDGQMNERRYEMEYDSSRHNLVRKTPYVQKTKQYPLKLAYAFTIHKAQGQTYEKVILDLKSHIFAPGQLYVALSRAKSLQGLFLTKPVTYSDIIADNAIFEFLDQIRGRGNDIPHQQSQSDNNNNIPLFEDFASIIIQNEESPSMRDYILHSLNSFKSLISCNEFEKADWELKKIADLIVSIYQIQQYNDIIEALNSQVNSLNKCCSALRTLIEFYENAINCPRKQFQSENRTLTVDLLSPIGDSSPDV